MLPSTVGVKFTRQQLLMVNLPQHVKELITGLLLSDGWLAFSSPQSKNIRLGFSQSLIHFNYFFCNYF